MERDFCSTQNLMEYPTIRFLKVGAAGVLGVPQQNAYGGRFPIYRSSAVNLLLLCFGSESSVLSPTSGLRCGSLLEPNLCEETGPSFLFGHLRVPGTFARETGTKSMRNRGRDVLDFVREGGLDQVTNSGDSEKAHA